MFTEGQKARMHACLNSSVADRNNLWSPSNLIATGTDDITYQLCTVAFETDEKIVCVGETVTLTDVSRHGVNSRTWTINGGTPSSISDSVITVTYNSPRVYSVGLSVSNGSQQIDTTYQDYIRVIPLSGSEDNLVESFENETTFNDKWAIIDNQFGYNWEVNTNTGRYSNQSIYINNFEANASKVYEFISSPIDASNLSDVIISFDYAYSKSDPSINEILKISVSKDCGETWVTRKSFLGTNALISFDTQLATAFTPNQDDHWKNDVVTNIPATYLVDN